jgi:hypothetical protein
MELPKRVTQRYIEDTCSSLKNDEQYVDFVNALKDRGWTQADIEERVAPSYIAEVTQKDTAIPAAIVSEPVEQQDDDPKEEVRIERIEGAQALSELYPVR